VLVVYVLSNIIKSALVSHILCSFVFYGRYDLFAIFSGVVYY